MTADELKQLLAQYGITPLKARGQHFLLDETVVRDMLAAAEVREGDAVLEVGPGPGVLTAALLDAGACVTAVDIDRRFAPLLEERFGKREFSLRIADALSATFQEFLSSRPASRDPQDALWIPGQARNDSNGSRNDRGNGIASSPAAPRNDGVAGVVEEFKVVANLPYGVTSEFIAKCLLETHGPRTVTLLIQREVAERIVAGAGDMNRLAVLVQTFAQARTVRLVKPGAFMPPPRVDSAVIHISRRSDEELRDFFGSVDPKIYLGLVASGFSAPRKQLKNVLSSRFSGYEGGASGALAAAGISERARPEELSIKDWKTLASLLTA